MDSVQSQQFVGTNSGTDQYSSPSQQRKNNNKIYIIVAVFLFILILGELGYVFLYHNSSFKRLLPSSFSILSLLQNKDNSNSTNTSSLIPTVTAAPQNNINIPGTTGQQTEGTGAASGFTVHLKKAIEKPTVIGDKPSKNLEYVEFDVAVTNNTSTTGLTPGMFYFQDAASGNLFMQANIFGHVPSYDWIIPAFSQKRVTVPDKNSVLTTEIPEGKTVNNLYLIYQVFPGEKGKLVWDTADTITEIKFGQEDTPAKVINYYMQNKIFELNATNDASNRIEVFSIP